MNKENQKRNIPKNIAIVLIGLLIVTIIGLTLIISQNTKNSAKFVAQNASDSQVDSNSENPIDPTDEQISANNQHPTINLSNINTETGKENEKAQDSTSEATSNKPSDSDPAISEKTNPDSNDTGESKPDSDSDTSVSGNNQTGKPAETTTSEIPIHSLSEYNYVALTFDDGPYDLVDLGILDLLNKYDAHATFFLVGSRIDYYPDTVKAIAEQGSEIANHSFNHPDLTTLSYEQLLSEINLTNEKIKQCTGITPTMIRPPYGACNDFVLESLPYPLINWNHDTEDWRLKDANLISQSIENTQPGSVILMHSLYPETLQALEQSLPVLYEQGYRFVTVSELYQIYGVPLVPHGLHNSPADELGLN